MKFLTTFYRAESKDGDVAEPEVQAGSRGLAHGDALRDYAPDPGELLQALRETKGLNITEAAAVAKITVERLRAYESGNVLVSPHDIVALGQLYGVEDLRSFMTALGARKADAPETSLGIAAMSAGDLDAPERDAVRSIVQAAVERRNAKKL